MASALAEPRAGAHGLAGREPDPRAEAGSFASRFRARLHDRRFWVIQAMVAAVTVGHSMLEVFEVTTGRELGAIYFIPASLYFFPVVYASLHFGEEGAIPTALWSACLAIPNIVVWHSGLARIGEAFQMVTMVLLAIIIAGRVDREVIARRRAELQERARRLSEIKYRNLFGSAGEPILVFSEDGRVHEMNAAAATLAGVAATRMAGSTLARLFGPAATTALLASARRPGPSGAEFELRREDGSDVWIEPVSAALPGEGGERLFQALLRDVTERHGLRSYTHEIMRAQERERQRIAQELHDVGIQSLVLLCRRLDTAAEAAGPELTEPAARALVLARRGAEELADDLRRFSRGLRPIILDDLGLVPAIRRLVEELAQHSPACGRLVVTGEQRRLPVEAELALFRIAQEALRNAERHAGACRVAVRLAYRTAEVRFTVADDGCGFDVPSLGALAGGGRLGLLGMRERARLLGGTCEIRSGPGHGTRVAVALPA